MPAPFLTVDDACWLFLRYLSGEAIGYRYSMRHFRIAYRLCDVFVETMVEGQERGDLPAERFRPALAVLFAGIEELRAPFWPMPAR